MTPVSSTTARTAPPARALQAVDLAEGGAPAGPAPHDLLPADGFLGRAAAAGVAVTSPLVAGGLVVDLRDYTVSLDGKPLDLSPRQVELLALFLAGPRTVWSREQLHRVCWGDTTPSRRVDVQLCRLRAKTGLDLFRNVRDRGWALRPVA